MSVKRMEMSRIRLLLLGVAVLGVFSAVGLLATNFDIYKISPGNYAEAKWPGANPNLTWNLNFIGTPSNVVGGGSPQTVLTNAFNAWHSATYNSSAVTNIAFTFGSANASLPQTPTIDCQNVIGFDDTTLGAFGSGIIAITIYATIPSGEVPSQCGANAPPPCPIAVCIVDADIMFNPTATFATSGATTGQFDLQSIAMHEIGHMIGLDHSGIAHAVMYPYGDTISIGVQQTLWTDDMIGAGHLYPGAAPPNATIEGQVKLDGAGIYGAHVEAVDVTTGNAVTDTLTDPSGNYTLLLFGGSYYVYVQSLATDSNHVPYTIGNFSGQAGYGNPLPPNPIDYTGAYY